MKLAEDNESLAQNKVLILYILNKIAKPISSDELLKLVLSITDMNYFYFQQFLLDLLEKKYIATYSCDNGSLYIVTEEGKQTLSLTNSIIPGILKLKIDNNFKDSLSEIKEESAVTAEFIPENENEYLVKCKLIENNRSLLDITLFAGSRIQAINIVNNWKQKANTLYPEIFKLLAETNEVNKD